MSRLGGAGRGLTRLTRAKNVPSFTSRTSCKATNRVFTPLQALQSLKTGFLCHCRRCNRPKPGFCTIAGIAIAQNQILEDLHGLQWLRIRFWRICTVCNGPESDSGGFAWSANGPESDSGRIAWSAIAQNQILEDLHGLQWPGIRFWGALRTNLGLEMSAPRGLSGWGDATPVDPALARRRTWAKRGSVPSRG